MKKITFLAVILFFTVKIFAWQGMPTPPLHVDGRWLKDPTGKNVLLHGYMQPSTSYFNGGVNYTNPTNYYPSDVAGELNYFKKVAGLMTHTGPLFGNSHGWNSSFVRYLDGRVGWDNDTLTDPAKFNRWITNMCVPYVNYCRSVGLYVVICGQPAWVNADDDGSKNMTSQYKQNLITWWTAVANAPGIKNADNVMFEICNEPVGIESSLGNGQWGWGDNTHNKAFQTYMQDIVNAIRNTGANNVTWVPSLGWQTSMSQFVNYPISGNDIGYVGHWYPYGDSNMSNFTNSFKTNWKPCTDRYPLLITECAWNANDSYGLINGTTDGFGSTTKSLFDTQGNVSWLIGMTGDDIGNLNKGWANITYPTTDCGQAAFDWWPTYTESAPDDGTPKFEYASVTGNNPKQIQVTMSKSIVDSSHFNGFTVKIDNQVVTIDSVVLGDTTQLVINLNVSILKNDQILLSYNNGNVVSIYEKNLVDFNDTLVDNLLKGAPPRLTELKTSKDGDTLIAKFNMKMQLPSDISALALKAEYNGDLSIPILESSFFNNDSTLLVFPLDEKVYADYQLLLSYSGTNIVSADSGLLKTFSDTLVTNNSKGFSVQIDTAKIGSDGLSGMLTFSKPLALIIKQSAFTIKVNKKSVSLKDLYSLNNTILFTLSSSLHFGDTITASYTPGNVTATDLGILGAFSNFPITNPIIEPHWLAIPGKIEAENYYAQSGTVTQSTSDIGGGFSIGYNDAGDWLEYGINNNTSDISYEITFRVASPSGDGKFDFYLDNVKIGEVTAPNTGGWQTWQSVVKNITIPQGKHYFKIVVTSYGFDINYLDIKKLATGIENLHDDIINIYPNPVSKEIIIGTADFRYNKVEIIDITGKTVLSKLTAYESELHIPVNLSSGVYIVKISNEKQFQLKRIIINNN